MKALIVINLCQLVVLMLIFINLPTDMFMRNMVDYLYKFFRKHECENEKEPTLNEIRERYNLPRIGEDEER